MVIDAVDADVGAERNAEQTRQRQRDVTRGRSESAFCMVSIV